MTVQTNAGDALQAHTKIAATKPQGANNAGRAAFVALPCHQSTAGLVQMASIKQNMVPWSARHALLANSEYLPKHGKWQLKSAICVREANTKATLAEHAAPAAHREPLPRCPQVRLNAHPAAAMQEQC